MKYKVPPRRFALSYSIRQILNTRACALVWAALLLLAVSCVAQAKPSFTVQPPPAWVQPVTAPSSDAGTSARDAESGVRFLLDDRQTRVSSKGVEGYFHFVEVVSTAAAVEKVSQLQLDFEPSYQSLVIHHIEIIRAGQTINVLHPSEIRIIEQEGELDQRLFNGTLSAVAFLSDVRPGDVIDYAYSVNGNNPVLAGNYADAFPLAENDPIDYLHTRLLWPSARRLFVRPQQTDLQPAVRQIGGETEYVWERRDVPAVETEDSTPSWFDPAPSVQLSEFETWADVARWAAPLYEVKTISPALKAQIEEWRQLPTAEARMLAARRFVQDEVRYLGIELGPYSHTPTQPSKVFERRFGDCKDKSLLLATILNALGIEAHTALVNTDARHALDTWQPSPYDFDHVIVEAELDGRTYWLDPTISYQRGTLATYYAPEYERALVMRPDTQSLTTIPLSSSPAPTTTVLDEYRVKSFDAPVAFSVTTSYRGMDADAVRYQLASKSRKDFAKESLNYYAEHDRSIQGDGLPEITDDEEANVISITERYTIPNFWKESAHEFLALRVGDELDKPNVSRRSMPLSVTFPVNVEETVEIHLPRAQEVTTGDETVEDEAMSFTAQASAENNIVRLHYSVRTKQDSVAAAGVEQHLAAIDSARDLASYDLKQGSPVASSPLFEGAREAFYLLVAVLAFLFFRGWTRRRRDARLAAPLMPTRIPSRPGAKPETAIRLREETEIKHFLTDVPCPGCGRHAFGESARQGLVYDEQRLVVVQLECERCRDSQDFYFALAV
jgi:transglutaminase-like putative cysteine protease